MASKKIMEINPDNKIVRDLKNKVERGQNDKIVRDLVMLLFETSLLTSGFSLEEPTSFAGRIHRIIETGLSIDDGDDYDEVPPLVENEN